MEKFSYPLLLFAFLLAASIPGAKLIIAEESDHLIPEKRPEIIIEAAKDVIRLAEST